ncbi:hypothetical protein L6164_023646 [Bauhinia variegata]|uniref:Uncharacterized protein n=1 Tax=Bauhinia variegata TaxID=167791 RepID=A0ACB9MJ64_BAUVA|nr:hypothetical protein L6164_023646 [Bauhinia variegata]
MEVNASGTAIAEVPSCILDLENLQELSFEGCKGLESKTWINWLLELWSTPQVPMDFSFRLPHSFSNLPMLRKLNLSYCNLSEGSIPGDIECLYFLESLDVSGNNFISLPNSISELSMLKFLHINCCKRLQSLPKLPSELEVLDARNSTSLKTFKSNFSKQCSLILFFFVTYSTKKHFLQETFHLPKKKFQIIIPGDKIPSWFDTQNSSSSATLRLQFPHSCPQWVGIAFSCLLVYKGYSPRRWSNYGYRISYDMDGVERYLSSVWSQGPHGEPSQPHLSIIYFSAIKLRERIYKDNDFREIEFRFETSCGSEGLEIIGCGGRVVYEQDFEDWNKTI